MKAPPSSYKMTASRAGNQGVAGRPTSTRGMNFTNKLSQKSELEGAQYREELTKKNNTPDDNLKKL